MSISPELSRRIAEAIAELDRATMPGGRAIASSLRSWALDSSVFSGETAFWAHGPVGIASRQVAQAESALSNANRIYDALRASGRASAEALNEAGRALARALARKTSARAALMEAENAAYDDVTSAEIPDVAVEAPLIEGEAGAELSAAEMEELAAEAWEPLLGVEAMGEAASATFAAEMSALAASAASAISSVIGIVAGLALLGTIAYQIAKHASDVANAGHPDADISKYTPQQKLEMADWWSRNVTNVTKDYPTQAQLDSEKAWREVQWTKYTNAAVSADNAIGRLIKIFVLRDYTPFVPKVGLPFDESAGSLQRQARDVMTRMIHNPFLNGDPALQQWRLSLIRSDPSFRGSSVTDAAVWYEDHYDAFHNREMETLQKAGFKFPSGMEPTSTSSSSPASTTLPQGMTRLTFNKSLNAFDRASLWASVNASCAVYDNPDEATMYMKSWNQQDVVGLAGALLIRLYTKEDIMIVACRGTLIPGGTWSALGSVANWFDNLVDLPGEVHAGNALDWSFLKTPFSRAIGTVGSFRKVILCGHSKGFLLALQARQCLSDLMYMPDDAISVYGFGGPKAFSQASSEAFNAHYPNVFRVEIQQDPAPSFPPNRYAVGLPYALSSGGLQQAETDKNIITFTTDLVHALWGAHLIYNYLDKIKAWMSGKPGGQSVFDLPANSEAQVGALMREVATRSKRSQSVIAQQAHAVITHFQASTPSTLKPDMRIYRLETCPPDITPSEVDIQRFEILSRA